MVAFHGEHKPASFIYLLDLILDKIAHSPLTPFYQSFNYYQIHATLIGMEAIVIKDHLYNRLFWENKNQSKREIAVRQLLNIIERMAQQNPIFTIHFGGFRKAYCHCEGTDLDIWNCASSDAEFHRYGHSLSEGSFYIVESGPVMMTGWAVQASDETNVFQHSLYIFHHEAEKAVFLDKYHFADKCH